MNTFWILIKNWQINVFFSSFSLSNFDIFSLNKIKCNYERGQGKLGKKLKMQLIEEEKHCNVLLAKYKKTLNKLCSSSLILKKILSIW